jgi:hypothetical protein
MGINRSWLTQVDAISLNLMSIAVVERVNFA